MMNIRSSFSNPVIFFLSFITKFIHLLFSAFSKQKKPIGISSSLFGRHPCHELPILNWQVKITYFFVYLHPMFFLKSFLIKIWFSINFRMVFEASLFNIFRENAPLQPKYTLFHVLVKSFFDFFNFFYLTEKLQAIPDFSKIWYSTLTSVSFLFQKILTLLS